MYKIKGGTLEELLHLTPTEKTIILMGEQHISLRHDDVLEFVYILEKQKAIINTAIEKFGKDKVLFYSEGPEECRTTMMSNRILHPCILAQYANSLIPIKLSTITFCTRDQHGFCDEQYADDILDVFTQQPTINCVVVATGLIHIPEIFKILKLKQPDIKVIIINTVSENQLQDILPSIQEVYPEQYPILTELLTTEPPYKLSDEDQRKGVSLFLKKYSLPSPAADSTSKKDGGKYSKKNIKRKRKSKRKYSKRI